MRRFATAAVIAALLFNVSAFAEEDHPSKPDILEIIAIDGEIGDATAAAITQQVKDINDNKRVRAVLLTVNSPGGGAVASSNINEELAKLKVPVVGWCNAECASGGMYVLMSPVVKFIGLRSQTIAGSIGVIMHMTRYNRLKDWARVDSEVFKSAPLKDAGSPDRDMTEDDRAYLQSIVSGLAQRFYDLVGAARGDKIKDWDAVKSARIFFGKGAVDIGLADAVMSYEDAEKKAKELSGSKAIYTRDEMKKIAADAGDDGHYAAPVFLPRAGFGSDDLTKAVELFEDLQRGETVRFEYLAPYRF